MRKLKLPDLPTVGIFAFALASTWALFQFFTNNALHPTWLYWIPAALVEIVTAWLTKNAIEAFYRVTRSNITKQDRRFFWIVAITSAVLAIPTLAASVQANLYEFRGQWWLALLFPVAVVGCAIGAQIPRSVERHDSADDDERKAELRELRAKMKEEHKEYAKSLTELRSKMEQSNILLAEAERKLKLPFAEAQSNGRGVPHSIARTVMWRDGWACYWCGRDLNSEPRHKIHVDHFYPASKGGATDAMNLVVSCQSCNLSKSDHLPSEKQVRDFKVYLVHNSQLQQKEKVWALHLTGILDKQKDIATSLGVSSSYVSSSLADIPSSSNGKVAELCEQLALVGKPVKEQGEQKDDVQ